MAMRKTITAIILLCLTMILFADPPRKTPPEPATQDQIAAVADSIVTQKEQVLLEEYGIRESSSLASVAGILKVRDITVWKHYLGLEAENSKLDKRTLRQLGITPYKAFLASQSAEYGFSELNTIAEVAARLNMPIKKLKAMLGRGLDPLTKTMDNRSLQSLDISPEDVRKVDRDFRDNQVNYSLILTFIGMLTVFVALLITSIVISQLVHINSKKKKPVQEIRITQTGKVVKAPKDLNRDVIAAAVAALHIYEHTIKERRRLILTFDRNTTSQWRASSVLNMPNREFFRKRS